MTEMCHPEAKTKPACRQAGIQEAKTGFPAEMGITNCGPGYRQVFQDLEVKQFDNERFYRPDVIGTPE